MPELTVNTESWERLDLDLAALRRELPHEVEMTTLPAVGEMIAQAARSKAGEHSMSIPPTIRVEMIPGAVRIHAGLEHPDDLIADLEKGFARFNAAKG